MHYPNYPVYDPEALGNMNHSKALQQYGLTSTILSTNSFPPVWEVLFIEYIRRVHGVPVYICRTRSMFLGVYVLETKDNKSSVATALREFGNLKNSLITDPKVIESYRNEKVMNEVAVNIVKDLIKNAPKLLPESIMITVDFS